MDTRRVTLLNDIHKVQPVMQKIIDCDGGNNFRIPHAGIREQMRKEGWDI